MGDSRVSTSSWQERWRSTYSSAQPILYSMRATMDPTPSSSRVLRVGQLDAEILDQELTRLLCEPLQKALGLVNARFDSELALIIQLMLYKFSFWDLGTSYGARLQGLKYITLGKSNDPASPSGLPRRTLVIHGMLTIVVPYFYNRFRAHALSRAWPDTPSSDARRMAWQMLTRLESTHSLLSLSNFVVFLWNGRYRCLSDRFLKMSLVPTSTQVKREISYEFMNRQMVWHAFTEFLLFLLPLINARSIQRLISRLMLQFTFPAILSNASKGDPRNTLRKHGKYETLPTDQCAICAENATYTLNLGYSVDASSITSEVETATDYEVPRFPIYTPYVTSCGHVHCYHCIAERMMRTADEGLDSGWECLRCAETVKSADRLEAEVSVPARSDTMSDYEFSSDLDVTDMSGSASSYMGSLSDS